MRERPDPPPDDALEDAARVVASAARLADRLRATAMAGADRDALLAALLDLAGHATAALAARCGATERRAPDDAEEVVRRGAAGWAALRQRYGLPESRDEAAARALEEFRAKVRALLVPRRPSNRTLIHEAILDFGDEATTRPLADLVESVTMGELAWTDFVREAEATLAALQRAG